MQMTVEKIRWTPSKICPETGVTLAYEAEGGLRISRRNYLADWTANVDPEDDKVHFRFEEEAAAYVADMREFDEEEWTAALQRINA